MATWLPFARVGIAWEKPFHIVALGHNLDLLSTPPRQVMEIVGAHARHHYDQRLLERLGLEHGWNMRAVREAYQHGIDWDLVRQLLRGDRNLEWGLRQDERVGLHLIVCGAFWPEHRRWRVGLRPSPVCEACGLEAGTECHRAHDCGAMASDIALSRAAGSLPPIPPHGRHEGLAPLMALGIPPKPLPWAPVEVQMDEGLIDPEPMQAVYGDGSGYLQQVRELRVASWAMVTMADADPGEVARHTRCRMRGSIGGWFSTVPRGELTALKSFLKHAGPGAAFYTDCQAVVDGYRLGIPETLTAASSLHADLWREVRLGVRDRDDGIVVRKTKAHRSRAAASRDADDHEGHRWGNGAADEYAKQLAHRMSREPNLEGQWTAQRELAVVIMKRVAYGVA